MARIAPSMAAPPAMSYFIFSMLSEGLIEMPPVSKVMPLPTRPSTGPSVTPSGSYRITISAGGSSDPCETLQNAPIFSSCSFSVEYTSHLQADFLAPSPRRAGRESVGVSLLPGSFTSERVKFWLSPMMTPSANAAFSAAWSAPAGAASVNDCTLWSLRSLR